MRARKETERADAIDCIPGGLHVEGTIYIYSDGMYDFIGQRTAKKNKSGRKNGAWHIWDFKCLQ